MENRMTVFPKFVHDIWNHINFVKKYNFDVHEDEYPKHLIEREFPWTCIVCGNQNTHFIADVIYRGEIWCTANFCCKKHLLKVVPAVFGGEHEYVMYKGIAMGIQTFVIPDQIEIDTNIFR